MKYAVIAFALAVSFGTGYQSHPKALVSMNSNSIAKNMEFENVTLFVKPDTTNSKIEGDLFKFSPIVRGF